MKIYRIALSSFCDVSGEGAKRFGGRWNMPGIPVLYGGSSVAIGLLERLTVDPDLFSSKRYTLYSVMEFECNDSLIYQARLKELPKGWDAIPSSTVSQEFGTKLFQAGVMCFQVPSVVDVSSHNFVINPLAKAFAKVTWKIYPLLLDHRIVR